MQRNKDVKRDTIRKFVKFIESIGFTKMDDGSWQHLDYILRVEFLEMKIRIDEFIDQFRYGIYEWRRLFSCYYNRIRFDEDGVPHGIGFHSHPTLIKLTNEVLGVKSGDVVKIGNDTFTARETYGNESGVRALRLEPRQRELNQVLDRLAARLEEEMQPLWSFRSLARAAYDEMIKIDEERYK